MHWWNLPFSEMGDITNTHKWHVRRSRVQRHCHQTKLLHVLHQNTIMQFLACSVNTSLVIHKSWIILERGRKKPHKHTWTQSSAVSKYRILVYTLKTNPSIALFQCINQSGFAVSFTLQLTGFIHNPGWLPLLEKGHSKVCKVEWNYKFCGSLPKDTRVPMPGDPRMQTIDIQQSCCCAGSSLKRDMHCLLVITGGWRGG